jgi:hypothetical protein
MAQALGVSIPLMIIAFGIWVGVPLYIVLRYPDRHPRENRSVPAYMRAQLQGVPRQRPPTIRARAYDGNRGLVSM